MVRHQLRVRLRATRDCDWERRFHRKLKGRFDGALRQAGRDYLHDSNRAAYTFSDPEPADGRPGQPLDAGDEIHLLVSSAQLDVLEIIADSLDADPEVTAGSFVFDARAARPVPVDVGPAGNRGTIETASGIVCTLRHASDTDTGTPEYWSCREHDVAAFHAAIRESARAILERETDVHLQADDALFDDYHLLKQYGVDVEVTPQNHITVVPSKWHFGFEVQSDGHRRLLNALLATGLGGKRAYGFGCLRVKTATHDATADAPTPGVA